MIKHYGNYLAGAGKSVRYKSEDIESLLIKRKKLLEELEKLEINIKTLENEFSMYIEDEWTKEEINEAKEKAKLNY